MVSDSLSNAVAQIREQLKGGTYGDEERGIIETLVARMECVRIYLDTPPEHQTLELHKARAYQAAFEAR